MVEGRSELREACLVLRLFEEQSRPRGWPLRSEVEHRLFVTVRVLFAPKLQQQGRHLG